MLGGDTQQAQFWALKRGFLSKTWLAYVLDPGSHPRPTTGGIQNLLSLTHLPLLFIRDGWFPKKYTGSVGFEYVSWFWLDTCVLGM